MHLLCFFKEGGGGGARGQEVRAGVGEAEVWLQKSCWMAKCFTHGLFSVKSKMFSSALSWLPPFLLRQVNPLNITKEGEAAQKRKTFKGHLKKSSAELRLNDFSTTIPVFLIVKWRWSYFDMFISHLYFSCDFSYHLYTFLFHCLPLVVCRSFL